MYCRTIVLASVLVDCIVLASVLVEGLVLANVLMDCLVLANVLVDCLVCNQCTGSLSCLSQYPGGLCSFSQCTGGQSCFGQCTGGRSCFSQWYSHYCIEGLAWPLFSSQMHITFILSSTLTGIYLSSVYLSICTEFFIVRKWCHWINPMFSSDTTLQPYVSSQVKVMWYLTSTQPLDKSHCLSVRLEDASGTNQIEAQNLVAPFVKGLCRGTI